MKAQNMSIERQRQIAAEIVELARQLESEGDLLIEGHCHHLRERAEAVLVVLETSEDSVS